MAFGGHHQVVEFFRFVDNNSSSVSNNHSFTAAFTRVLAHLPSNFFSDRSLMNVNSDTLNGANTNSSKLNRLAFMGTMSDIRALEHQTIKVPYEILNKKFRLAQKNIDREVSHVQSTIQELETIVEQSKEDETVTIGKINELLVGVVNKLTVLKRKSVESISDEINAVNVCKRRLDHLKEYYFLSNNNSNSNVMSVGSASSSTISSINNNMASENNVSNSSRKSSQSSENPLLTNDQDNPAIINWKRKRMDRMLVDHCLRAGYYETAIQLAKCSDIESLTNIDIFLICKDIESSLARHETSRCLAWCHENKTKLRKIKSTLEFSLRQQEFIELIRSDQRMEAVRYAQKYFSNQEELVGIVTPTELNRVMGLLACHSNTSIERYKSLFDLNRWNILIQQFRSENFKLYQLSNASIFSITLQAGLSSLKTPQCYRKDGNRNNECPVCSEGLNKLASSLPCAHCSQSRLVCFISGEPMNEHNQPLMLPNGYVYGEKSLKKMANENDGMVICPRTNTSYNFKDIEKVYVM
ncbi:E3 ubiquitin-protein transferase MAEA [Sarcoptes scabiei]|uniref:E3 ubiquitin-protein transferase MAEA n=1 Tax=Sarcoptes scabiei TaxID=52283 RepID=A0A131ZXC3_SARSC|nr:E3 ubiquitin-protein transferase MAEA [Sarcoptes scabiei]KPM02935.1 macrophage erythroblast attacher-like protein [Sarcoptes scabiei]